MTHPRYMKDVDAITLYRKGTVVIVLSDVLNVLVEEVGDCEFHVTFSDESRHRLMYICEEEVVAWIKQYAQSPHLGARSNDLSVLTERRAGYTCYSFKHIQQSMFKGMTTTTDKPTVDKVEEDLATRLRLAREQADDIRKLISKIKYQAEYITSLEHQNEELRRRQDDWYDIDDATSEGDS